MVQLYAGVGVLVAVLVAAAVIGRGRSKRSRRSRELVEASEVASWMSQLMDAVDQPLPWHRDEVAEVVEVAEAPTGPPRAVTLTVVRDEQEPELDPEVEAEFDAEVAARFAALFADAPPALLAGPPAAAPLVPLAR